MKSRSHRGLSTTGIVAGLVGLVVVVLVIVYFASDVWRTKADAALTQFTQWTPENIAKDPVNYLNFCETQTKAALEKCKASKIAIAQKKAKIESMRKEAADKQAIGDKALGELKVLYKTADESASAGFPLKWQTKELSKDDAKRQVVKLDKDVKSKLQLISKLDGALVQLNVQSNKLAEAEDNAKEQLAKIDTNREMLKVQEITDSIKNNLVAMKGAIETSIVGINSTDSGTVSLDELAAQSEAAVNDADFNKILNEK